MIGSSKNCKDQGKNLANDTDKSELTANKFYQKRMKF